MREIIYFNSLRFFPYKCPILKDFNFICGFMFLLLYFFLIQWINAKYIKTCTSCPMLWFLKCVPNHGCNCLKLVLTVLYCNCLKLVLTVLYCNCLKLVLTVLHSNRLKLVLTVLYYNRLKLILSVLYCNCLNLVLTVLYCNCQKLVLTDLYCDCQKLVPTVIFQLFGTCTFCPMLLLDKTCTKCHTS